MKLRTVLRNGLLAIATLVAGWVSLVMVGGILVFGFGRTISEICFLFVPFCALPIAVIGCWNSRVGTALATLMCALFFGSQLAINWPLVAPVIKDWLRNQFDLAVWAVWLLLLSAFLLRDRPTPGKNAA